MKGSQKHTWKTAVSRMLITCMVVLSMVIITPNIANAASTPKLTKTTTNILEGKKYDLNVSNKISKSTYAWSTSNKKVATVDKKGVVKAVKKGSVTITCKVKAPKKTYSLKCKVSVLKPALSVKISNKTAALNLGQQYDLNRSLAPSTSNDKTYWTSSNKNIIAPDKNGKFTALKTGTVTLTAKTLSGVKDTVKITVVDKDGTVSTQSDLDTLVKSAASNITIKTNDEAAFTIAAGDYSKKNLVVDAPKADVTNNGTFASVEVDQIKSNTWFENAKGNTLVVKADARIVVGMNATTSIDINKDAAAVKIENNGSVKKLHIIKAGKVELSGSSKEKIPVVVDSPVVIKSSVPLTITATAKIELTLLKGAEGTTIQVDSEANMPVINTEVTITVTIGSGATAVTKTIEGSSSIGGGFGGGGSTPPSGTTILINKVIDGVESISVTNTNGDVFSTDSIIDPDTFTMIKNALKTNTAGSAWIIMPDVIDKQIGAQKVSIVGKLLSTKKVTIKGGQLDGKTYDVTVENSYATIKNAAGDTITLRRNSDDTCSVVTNVTLDDALAADSTTKVANGVASISVKYNGVTHTVVCPDLATIKGYIDHSSDYYTQWMNNADITSVVGGQTVTFKGTGKTKTVTFDSGRSYTVTANSETSVTVSNGTVSATISKATDTLTVTLN